MLRIGWIFTVVRKPEGKGWFVTIHKFRFVNLSIFQRRYDELSTDYRTFKAVLESTRSLLYENARRFACREREREEMAEEGETEIRSGRGVARLEKRREVESRGNNFPRERFPRGKYEAVALRRNAQTKFSILKGGSLPSFFQNIPFERFLKSLIRLQTGSLK